MIAERIKMLREKSGISQAALAKRIGITRSSVNAWEMGFNIPTTKNIIQLSKLFHVSTDCLLCMPQNSSLAVYGLTDDDIKVVYSLILHLKRKNSEP